jgi:hypothetical protein
MAETQICPTCHSVNPINNVFCQVCGNKLSVANPPEPPQGSARSSSSSLPPIPQARVTPPMPPVPPVVPTTLYPPVAPQPPASSMDVLGIKVDEFSDIMVDDAPRSGELTKIFLKALKDRNIPQLQISEGDFTAEGKRRHYQVITGPAKTTFLASIHPFGKDLILGWEMYIKRTFKWVPLVIMAGVVVILPLFSALFSTLSYGGPITFSSYWTNFFQFLFYTALAGLLIGKVFKDDWLYLFVEDIDEISWSEAMALQLVVHEALLETMETIQIDLPKPVTKSAAKPTAKGTVKTAIKPGAKPKPKGKKK